MLTLDFDLLGVSKGDIILDSGCGEGRHSFECLSRGAKVFSMDMDLESLKKSKYTLESIRRNQCKNDGIYLVHKGDALNLPFKNNTFDRIICSEVMEHVKDDDLACREISRVLRDGGRVAITVPTYFSEIIYYILTYEYFTSPGGHVRRYFPKNLAKIMERNNLHIYDIGFKHSFHTIYWMIRSVVGLHLNDHPITKSYRKLLTLSLHSKLLTKVESFFDNFFPKSMVFYAFKKK